MKNYLRTIFTGIDRYNYTDPDYAYNQIEQAKFENHKRIYKNYLESLNFHRIEKMRNKYLIIYFIILKSTLIIFF